MKQADDRRWERLRFGAYLVSQQRVLPADVETALSLQSNRRVRLGDLARSQQLLTDDQIDKIVDFQNGASVRFGEAAVQIGLLDERQVDALLIEQKARHSMLGEILVEMQKLSPDALQDNLDAYFEKLAVETDLATLDPLFTPDERK